MKKIYIILVLVLALGKISAQTQAPGLDVLGFGYDVFGNYADQKSKKRYNLFVYSNFKSTPIGTTSYNVPQYVFFENISNHIVSTVSGSSIREYSKSLSAKVGLQTDAMFFSGSVNSSYSTNSTGKEEKFYYTYMDANTKWRISFDERSLGNLKNILDPQFKNDLENMDPARLFELYGTHYIASAYLGGRADYTSVSTLTTNTNTKDISLAVEAKYLSVSGSVNIDKKSQDTLSQAKTETKLTVTGGNSQYANNISNFDVYKLWADGIEDMPVLCDFDSNSLRPIWEFASTESRKAQLKAEFDRMCKANPLPAAIANSMRVQNQVYYVKSKLTDNYWDLTGYHYYAEKKGGKISLHEKDINSDKVQGADRFIKVIAHVTKPEFVFFQPQHSDFVADITGGVSTSGAELQLWDKSENNESQMFRMLPVDGEPNTYFIENSRSKLFLTSHKDTNKITQEVFNKNNSQKWVFENSNPVKDMAPPPTEIFSIKNVKANRYIDVPGPSYKAEHQGAKLQLWDLDSNPDRFFLFHASSQKNYFSIQPLHGKEKFDIEGGQTKNSTRLQLYESNDSASQLFRFEYAGSPLTYYIINKNSNKPLDASENKISENECPIQIWDFNGGDNQKWKLDFYRTWQMPPANQSFYVKSLYTDKYWDLPGKGAETNGNGKQLASYDIDDGADRKFNFIPSGDNSWVFIQAQNGGRVLDVPGNSSDRGANIQLYDFNGSQAQKFAIMFTSTTSCTFVTNNWKTLDIQGGHSDDWKKNGAKIIQWDTNLTDNQQFQLIYADGPQKGQIFKFEVSK